MKNLRVTSCISLCVVVAWGVLSFSTMTPSTTSTTVDDFLIPTTVPSSEPRTTVLKALRKVALPSRVVPHYPLMAQELRDMATAPGDNSVGPTEEEIRHAREALIMPLAPLEKQRSYASQDAEIILQWFQINQSAVDPIVVEMSPKSSLTSWGRALASVHPNATVISLCHECHHGTTNEGSNDLPTNQYLLEQPEKGAFDPFYKVCHFFSVLFIPDLFLLDVNLITLERLLPLARTSYIAAPESILGLLQKVVSCKIRWTLIAERTAYCLVRVDVTHVQRGCLKTWDAKETQWGRRTTVAYDGSVVSFEVQSKTKRLARRIHPYSYIPSINVNTLLSMGISQAMSLSILAKMIATPRYSDPMPHNWLIGRGGSVLRIDKVDKRYDEDVNEGTSFWGRNTIGYLRLLTENLCLTADPKVGVPEIVLPQCKSQCTECATCSYVPKGFNVCPACLSCSKCIARVSSQVDPRGSIKPCRFPYSTWHGGMRVWNRWEKESKK